MSASSPSFASHATSVAVIALNLSLWSWILAIGWDLDQSLVARNVPGHPNIGQRIYYLAIPLIALAINTIAPALSVMQKERIRRWPSIVTLVIFVPYVMAYTGGI